MSEWWKSFFPGKKGISINESAALLVEKSIQAGQGQLSAQGALVVKSGKLTGRAADDKYIVTDKYSSSVINWKSNLRAMAPDKFETIKDQVIRHLKEDDIFIMERSAGADAVFSLGVRLISSSPVHALFASLIFRPDKVENRLGNYTIFHAPDLWLDFEKLELRSSTAIIISYETKEIVICGTEYCGEIKKAIFTVMNTILPDHGIFPMHTGSSMTPEGKVSLFFGLSGTGKTTLSTDEGMKVIGDDEHGLSDQGVFNFEGGCYAKTYGLKETTEPQIFRAAIKFGSLLENVVLNEKREPLFDDKSITENGRATYPLSALKDSIPEGRGAVPDNFFFLSADALGVLPALSKLDNEQAMYFFLSGYTAKLAGTEAGSKDISTTFSHCFGAPFMLRRPMDYGFLLKDFLKKHSINVWLINTGWYGGAYGVGQRYPLAFTRSCIRAVQQGKVNGVEFTTDPLFGLKIPKQVPGLKSEMLDPGKLWKDQEAYDRSARDLKAKFDENFKKFEV